MSAPALGIDIAKQTMEVVLLVDGRDEEVSASESICHRRSDLSLIKIHKASVIADETDLLRKMKEG